MTDNSLTDAVRNYYEGRLNTFGATPKGVDWSSTESELRFDQLLARSVTEAGRSLLDYGCGFGALVTYLSCQD